MNWMGLLQQFNRSLMLPMIALPAAAILLFLGNFPWQAWGASEVGEVLRFSGHSIFYLLPFVFAVGVALGLTDNASSAGLSALIGYFLFMGITEYYVHSPIQLGAAGGILIGILAALSYRRFKNIQFPEMLQFFGGARFVPLFMCFATILLSVFMIWSGPWIVESLRQFSSFLLGLGGFGAFVYGVLHRLLVPTGLHYILNNIFWFQVGFYETDSGQVIYGDLPRFFAGDPQAGLYMAGLYPVMMFALPAIALAIVHEAREDLKPRVRATFITAALTCFLTGVTEPIEFAFVFVAPYLFVVHAVLSGLAMWIVHMLDIHHGFAFSAGAIDFFLNFHLSRNALLLIPLGLVYGTAYYVMFRWAIRRFQIPTPGREDGPLDEWAGDVPRRAPLILQALGGKNNIASIESCITRLRLTLEDEDKIDTASLKHLGAAGTIHLGGGNVQVVFGTLSELISEEIKKLMLKDLKQTLFVAPFQGKMIPLAEVPDKIFAAKLVGDGVAFIPERGQMVSPIHGKVVQVYPTKHALGIETPDGLQVLLHIGIDTTHLQGKGFSVLVEEGSEVQPGQLLVKFDLARVKSECKSTVSPMVITNSDKVKSWNFSPFKGVKMGQSYVMSVVLKEEEGETHGAERKI